MNGPLGYVIPNEYQDKNKHGHLSNTLTQAVLKFSAYGETMTIHSSYVFTDNFSTCADRPGAKPDFRNLQSCLAQYAVFHGVSIVDS